VTQTRVAEELDRLLARRAGQTSGRPVDTGAESWTVLADRERNEFSVGTCPKETLIR
jgi:hypothetical protein